MKYYSTQRPVAQGTFPKPDGNRVIEIVNFDKRSIVGRLAVTAGLH